MPFKAFIVVAVVLLAICGVAGTLVAASAIVEHLSTNDRPELLLAAVGAGLFGLGAIITAVLCARLALLAVGSPKANGPRPVRHARFHI